MDALTPTQQQAKKRGRPKGSKTKEDRDASAAKTTTSGGVVNKVRGGDKKVAAVDDKYTQWKALVPVLYDWFANHNLLWPSLSCRYPHLFLLPRSLISVSRASNSACI